MGIGVNTSTPTSATPSSGLSGLSDDKFEEYRKSKSYTYSRDPNGRRRRESIGCFRCGKVYIILKKLFKIINIYYYFNFIFF